MRKPKQSTSIRPLSRAFFNRDPRRVARELLGKVLVRQGDARQRDVRQGDVRQEDRSRLTARIVEVEAYLGEKDPAAHAAAGRTARTAVLFGPPGHAYVYFIYGSHYCLNVSCEPEGRGGGVLFRALEPLSGMEQMAQARGVVVHGPKDLVKLTSGPGRLCEAFAITRARDNDCDLTSAASSLFIGELIGEPIGEDGYRARRIRTTPRIGITKAVDKPLRYLLDGNPFVSGRKMYPPHASRKSGAPVHGTATRQRRD
jgi:DNA-3-methyladenine glycosylase